MRVLVAEDEPVSCRLVERALAGWGHEVVVARDGAEAWAALQRGTRRRSPSSTG
jgi:two-component system cell cycle response regulator